MKVMILRIVIEIHQPTLLFKQLSLLWYYRGPRVTQDQLVLQVLPDLRGRREMKEHLDLMEMLDHW